MSLDVNTPLLVEGATKALQLEQQAIAAPVQERAAVDVMLDLETMSVRPDAAVVAIGAVAFDRAAARILSEFYVRVDLASAQRCGGHLDADTVIWWLQQSEAARAELWHADRRDLMVALLEFQRWIKSVAEAETVKVWGDGSDFDNVILASAYRSAYLEQPWRWWNNRCFRTLRKQHPGIEAPALDDLVEHHALSDAKHQALHLFAIDAANGAAAQ